MGIVFHLAAGLSVAVALLAVLASSAERAALLLATLSLLIGLELIAIGAPFLAIAQLFLQIGPIVALTRHRGDREVGLGEGPSKAPSGGEARVPRPWVAVSAVSAALVFALFAGAALSSRAVGEPVGPDLLAAPESRAGADAGGARSVGESLYASSLPALEAAGVLILASTVAVSTLAGRRRGFPERTP